MIRNNLFFVLALSLCGVAAAKDGDIDKVNGSINVGEHETAGALSTVNGGIRLSAGATASSAETVNGGIHLGRDARLNSAETVNGGVTLDEGAHVAQTVETVNGGISLAAGAEVGGQVENVNGGIRLNAAHVGGAIKTVGGDIDIGANSRVDGGLLIEKSNTGWFNWGSGSEKKPRVVIGPKAVVSGTLVFRREVDLLVSDSATIGPVDGATPVKFSGDTPPAR
jgi:DUF4097 and DUF4098 domain-containing protein YvlB